MTSTEPGRRRPPQSNGERRELRRFFRNRRRQLSTAQQRANAEAVASHFFASGLLLNSRTIGAYFANERDGELSTLPLLARLVATRRRLALPVVGQAGTMALYRYRRHTPLVANRFGIPEPAPSASCVMPLSVDLLLVPLVAFDGYGVRLGMGAGYYDRYLGRVPPPMRPRLVGLAHEVQRSLDPLPFAEWDVPLHGVITERGWQTLDIP